jgi:hypothetical protein
VLNLVSDIKGGTQTEGVREQGAEERDEATGGWRKLHNEELHNFYSSPSIIRMIKSRRMRWAGHAVLMGENKTAFRILVRWPE